MEGVPSSRGYRNGFSSAFMLKDLGLAATAAERCGAPLPMSEQAAQLYQRVGVTGSGGRQGVGPGRGGRAVRGGMRR